jgi:aldose 1-epimerase
MSRFQVSEENRPTRNGLDGRFIILEDREYAARAEIWPALGFNCVRWATHHAGRAAERLYASPQLLDESRPTRSGIPILFPFPNRIREGRFTWDGKTYQLPRNDSTQKNAIHGFACRYPWRIVGQGASEDAGAWVTGEFWASKDAPEILNQWPADHMIQITYRLRKRALAIEAVVSNPAPVALPFGLGYHPYFALPAAPEQTLVEVPAQEFWELRDGLPTGTRRPVDPRTDLRKPRPYAGLQLDDVLTGVDPAGAFEYPGLFRRGQVRDAAGRALLDLLTAEDFREVVAFTPPHRQAICLEPYTCVTDAINLQQQGIEAGWRVLARGGRWSGAVVLVSSLG